MMPGTVDDEGIVYPESDGLPMADNTKQFRWITTIKTNLDALFHDDPLVFVAGDFFWYPVKGQPGIRRAPDTMVVFGRPKGDRGSYLQWKEGNIAPQVVFEIMSPGNSAAEMREKFAFYDRYGVEEYYVYDPDEHTLQGWLRQGPHLREVVPMDGHVSPRLGIRFVLTNDDLEILAPNGEPFVTFEEERQARLWAEQRADDARKREEDSRRQAEEYRRQNERLVAKLRELGLDPEAL